MSLLRRIEQAETASHKEVALIAQRALPAINKEPIPGAVDDHSRIESLREKLVEGLTLLTDPANKPSIARKEVYPGMIITTLFFDKDEKRVQVTETSEHTAILLVATRRTREQVEKRPQLMVEDAEALTFVFAPRNFIKPVSVTANPNVRFRSEVTQNQIEEVGGTFSAIDRLQTVINATNLSQPMAPSRLKEMRPLLEQKKQEAKGQVDLMHMAMLDTMREVIAKGHFDTNQSESWRISPGIQNALVRSLDTLMNHPLEAKAFGVEGVIPDRKYSLLDIGSHTVYVHEIRGKYGTVSVYEGRYDPMNPQPNQEPQLVITVDLQDKVGRIEKISMLFSSASLASRG